MKKTISGKRYDTSKCEVLGEIDHYDYGNNYSGTTRLIRASNGQLLEWCDSWLRNYVCTWEESERSIDDFHMTDEQEARCAELGLIEIVG